MNGYEVTLVLDVDDPETVGRMSVAIKANSMPEAAYLMMNRLDSLQGFAASEVIQILVTRPGTDVAGNLLIPSSGEGRRVNPIDEDALNTWAADVNGDVIGVVSAKPWAGVLIEVFPPEESGKFELRVTQRGPKALQLDETLGLLDAAAQTVRAQIIKARNTRS